MEFAVTHLYITVKYRKLNMNLRCTNKRMIGDVMETSIAYVDDDDRSTTALVLEPRMYFMKSQPSLAT